MSHERTELVMPPTTDVEAAVEEVLAPFGEKGDRDDCHAWWDYWVIGGRWSGQKLLEGLDQKKLSAFHQMLTEKKVTVSGIVCGKAALSPSSWIPVVDALWRAHFPGVGDACPLFHHYKEGRGDVMRLGDVPEGVTAARVVIAGRWVGGVLRAQAMWSRSVWNGVSWQDTTWDGTLASALARYREKYANTTAEWKKAMIPTNDWLVVTIDSRS